MNKLINLSNHPSDKWSEEQMNAALRYGEVVDMPFPMVKADANEADIDILADDLAEKIKEYGSPDVVSVHIMGEMTLIFSLVLKLKASGYRCLASTTDRLVRDLDEGRKEVFFKFVRFREY